MTSISIIKAEVVSDGVSEKRSDGNWNAEFAPFLVEHVSRQILHVLVRAFRRVLFQTRHLARFRQVWIVQVELGRRGRKRDDVADFGED